MTKNNYRKIAYLFLIGILFTIYLFCQTFDKLEKREYLIKPKSQEGVNQADNQSEKFKNEWFSGTRYHKKFGFSKVGEVMLDYITRQSTASNNTRLKSASMVSSISNTWTSLGPTSMPNTTCTISNSPSGIGRVECIWADPTITSTIYVGGMNGGLWKKELNGNWVNLTDHLYSFGVLDIVVDPTNPLKIYIATGCFVSNGGSINNGGYGLGVFFTEDGGNTWITDKMATIPSNDLFIVDLLIDPNNSNTIYALSKRSVYKSTNGGYNWTNTAPPSSSSTEFIDMVMKPNDSNTLFICAKTNEIYRTTNGASTWTTTNLANNLTQSGSRTKMGMAVSADEPNTLFAIYTLGTGTYAFLEKSTDNGGSWSSIVNNKPIYCANYTPLRLAVSPANSDNIYVGGIYFYKVDLVNCSFVKKTSGNLIPINKRLHDDMRDILVVNNAANDVVYVGNDGGVSRSDDAASTWTAIDEGLQIGLFYSISSCDATPGVLIGGAHDCSSHIYDGATWYNTSCLYSDGGSALVDDTNKDIMYALYGSYINRTEDKGVTWASTQFYNIEYDSPILQDPTNSQKIYYGEWHPTVSYDKGVTIQSLTTIGSGRVTEMDICNSNPNVFYFARAGYNGSNIFIGSTVYRRSDNGLSWSDLTSNIGSILNDVRVTGIKIQPTNPNTVWVTVGGLEGGNKVYQTQDGGSSWQNISYNLDNFPVQCIDFDEYNNNIYLGTDIGVFYKNTRETVWHEFVDFPHVLVSDIEINKVSGKLYASTFGRGIWEMVIPGLCYTGNTTYINSSTTWNSVMNLCDNLTINSGTLTIQSDVLMSYKSTITVKSGATLIIDAGKITNANIIAESGSKINFKNNAILEIKSNDNLNINPGAEFDFSFGSINIIPD